MTLPGLGEKIVANTIDFGTIDFTHAGSARRNLIRIAAAIVALLLVFWLSPFGTIAAGERGVHLRCHCGDGKSVWRGFVFSDSTYRVGADDGCESSKI
jgi:hypothetical protein